MGVLDLRKVESPYEKLRIIHDKTGALCDLHHPRLPCDRVAVLRTQRPGHLQARKGPGRGCRRGLERGAEVHEYAPRKAKIAVCGNGGASKEQVCLMSQKILGIKIANKFLDATDALALALCHFYQMSSPLSGREGSSSWEKFVAANPERILKK